MLWSRLYHNFFRSLYNEITLDRLCRCASWIYFLSHNDDLKGNSFTTSFLGYILLEKVSLLDIGKSLA